MKLSLMRAKYPHFFINKQRTVRIDYPLLDPGRVDSTKQAMRALHTTRCEPITLHLNSPGGDLAWGWEILEEAAAAVPDRLVTTVACGQCQSAACEMLVLGDYAIAEAGTQLLIHAGLSDYAAFCATQAPRTPTRQEFKQRTLKLLKERVTFLLRPVATRWVTNKLLCGIQNLPTDITLSPALANIAGFAALTADMNTAALTAAQSLALRRNDYLLSVDSAEQHRILKQALPDQGQELFRRCAAVVRSLFKQDSTPTIEDARAIGLIDEGGNDRLWSRRTYVAGH